MRYRRKLTAVWRLAIANLTAGVPTNKCRGGGREGGGRLTGAAWQIKVRVLSISQYPETRKRSVNRLVSHCNVGEMTSRGETH